MSPARGLGESMTHYRLYFGGSDRKGRIPQELVDHFIQDVVVRTWDGFTVLHGTGYWQGKSEPVTVVEVVGDEETYGPSVDFVASQYVKEFNQDSVLVTTTPVGFELVTDGKAVAA